MGDVRNDLGLYFSLRSGGESLLSAAASALLVVTTGARER